MAPESNVGSRFAGSEDRTVSPGSRARILLAFATALVAAGTAARAQVAGNADPTSGFWPSAGAARLVAAEAELREAHRALLRLQLVRDQAASQLQPSAADWEQLRIRFVAIVQRAPTARTAWIDLADIDQQLGAPTVMLTDLEHASADLGFDPDRARVLFQLGLAYTETSQFERARQAYVDLLELPVREAMRGVALCNLAEIETYLAHVEDSVRHYLACTERLPAEAGGWWGLASAFDRAGRQTEARAAAREALDRDPSAESLRDPRVFYTPAYEVHYYAGLAAEAMERWSAAGDEWQRYLSEGGEHDAWSYRVRAHLRALEGRPSTGAHRRSLRGAARGGTPNRGRR